jgi:hypothetical protein
MTKNVIEIVKKRISKKLVLPVDSHAEITKIAKQLYERGGRRDGYELDDWFEAEALFKMQTSPKKSKLTSR